MIDPTEQAMLDRLSRLAAGQKADPFAPFESQPTQEEMFRAREQYQALKSAIDAREGRVAQLAVDQQRANADQQRAETDRLRAAGDLEVARARLQLDADIARSRAEVEFAQIEVKKAEVLVRALEVAKSDPQLLGRMAEAITAKLLGGTPLPAIEGPTDE